MQINILNLFNKILECQGVDTTVGKVLEYITGNVYIIEDIYNTVYEYNEIHDKYYIILEDGTKIEYDTLDTFVFSVKWLNN